MRSEIILLFCIFLSSCALNENTYVADEKPEYIFLNESLEKESAPVLNEKNIEAFSVTLDPEIRVSEGNVPYIYKTKDNSYRLFYCGKGGIISAISKDSINFQKESGVRLESGKEGTIVCDATVVNSIDGKIRMYYKLASDPGGPGKAVHKIMSAISKDGLTFENEGIRIDSEKNDDRGWASVPEAILLPDGKVRIYYVSNSIESGHGIVSALSSDGLNFEKERTILTGFVDPAVTILDDNTYLLIASVLPAKPGESTTKTLASGIYGLTSKDGITFSDITPIYINDGAIDPSIVKISNNTFRVYFWNSNETPPKIRSFLLTFS